MVSWLADEARFAMRLELDVRADVVSAVAAQVPAGMVLTILTPASVDLRRANLGPGSALRAVGAKVVSLSGAYVTDLVLANVDLSRCLFAGAQGLDRLRLEGDARFLAGPRRPWASRRRVLAEEWLWRGLVLRRRGWQHLPPELADQYDSDDPLVQNLRPNEIGSAYRSLRKGYEDAKNEPAAADFYYGEMEMRRLSAGKVGRGRSVSNDVGERLVTFLYWLTAGYGLRASRALAALAATIFVFAAAFYVFGFDHQPAWRALLFSAESAISLFRAPDAPKPNAVGETLELPLRLLGPLFFGLAVLALRGRVKR